MTRQQIETALSEGRLWAAMRNGRYWKLRRNGATQLWKTRPFDFRIPVKAGLKSYGEVTHFSRVAYLSDPEFSAADFVVSFGQDPNEGTR